MTKPMRFKLTLRTILLRLNAGMVIGFDIDGVLADFITPFLADARPARRMRRH